MRIKIDALDTLFFGAGKPAVWGEDTFSAGIFPPFPSVVRGAVRANWLYTNGGYEMTDPNDDPTNAFRIVEYALLMDEQPFFPVPADFVLDDEKGILISCELKLNDGLSSLDPIKIPFQLCAEAEGKVIPAEKRYFSKGDLEKYLNGNKLGFDAIALSDRITAEGRTGFYRNRGTKTVKEHMLYHAQLTRMEAFDKESNAFKKLSIAASIDGANNTEGVVRFGSKGKVARFIEYPDELSPGVPEIKNGCFKIYLATPAIFNNGWEPSLNMLSYKPRLLTAAVYGYDSAGGYDMKENTPKPMRRAVRAGSVYYYKIEGKDNTPENLTDILALHGTSISDVSSVDGFGICYIGKYGEEN